MTPPHPGFAIDRECPASREVSRRGMTFAKRGFTFPSKNEYVFLAHCSASPLYRGACREVQRLCEKQTILGPFVFAEDYNRTLTRLRQAAADLLLARPDDLAFVRNTSEGIGLVAA